MLAEGAGALSLAALSGAAAGLSVRGGRTGVAWLGAAAAAGSVGLGRGSLATLSAELGSLTALSSLPSASASASPGSDLSLLRPDFLEGLVGLGGFGGALIHSPPVVRAP